MGFSQKKSFEDKGYIILRKFLPLEVFDEIKAEIKDVGKFIIGEDFDFDSYQDSLISPKMQSQLYDRLHYLPGLSRLSGHLKLLDACRSLGIEIPMLMGCCNMRYDRPNDHKHLFDWHQDSVYLLGSSNSVTIWIPFGPVNEYYGSIQVIEGSHVHGIRPFKKISNKVISSQVQFLQRDLAIDEIITDSPTTIEATVGDVVIFKQMLLHRSLPNHSNNVRWTAQVRVSDLAFPGFLEDGCPTGDKTNIFFHNYEGYKYPMSNLK